MQCVWPISDSILSPGAHSESRDSTTGQEKWGSNIFTWISYHMKVPHRRGKLGRPEDTAPTQHPAQDVGMFSMRLATVLPLALGEWIRNFAQGESCYRNRMHWISPQRTWLCNGTWLQYACLENPMDGGAW